MFIKDIAPHSVNKNGKINIRKGRVETLKSYEWLKINQKIKYHYMF